MQRGAEAQESGFVDRVGRMKAIAHRQIQPMADVIFGIEINETGLVFAQFIVMREVGRSRVHRGPLDKPAAREFLDVGKALLRRLFASLAFEPVGRNGRIDDCIHLGADAFDDARVDVRILGLPPAHLVVGMHVHDCSTGLHTGDALFDDVLHGNRNAGLAALGPGSVQRHFQPGLLRDGVHALCLVRRQIQTTVTTNSPKPSTPPTI